MIGKILISRTDNLGDVVLTLPMAGVLKEAFPDSKIAFLGKSYTRSLIESSGFIDEFYDWEKLSKSEEADKLKFIGADVIIHVFPNKAIAIAAKKSGIKTRIGTSHRFFHWFTCNHLINLGRKKSKLHESQLNLQLLKVLGINKFFGVKDIEFYYGLQVSPSREKFKDFFSADKFNLLVHPKSKGSAREWGLANFQQLIETLPEEKYNIIITGTREEGELISRETSGFFKKKNVHNVTGKYSLKELIELIATADGLVAGSTGPLHIASALGKYALGLYPPIRPMHPERWGPIGKKASYITFNKECSDCRKSKQCTCLASIKALEVAERIQSWNK